MDTAENSKEKMIEEEKARIRQIFIVKKLDEFADLRKTAVEINQETTAFIDQVINAEELGQDFRRDLRLFKANLQMHQINMLSILGVAEFAYNLSQTNFNAILYVVEKMGKNSSTTNEIKETMSKLEAVLEEKRIGEIAKIMEKLEKGMEAGTKASEAYRV